MTNLSESHRKLVDFLTDLDVKCIQHKTGQEWYRFLDKEALFEAPFTSNLAVNWKKKEIHYAGSIAPWPHLVHEAGHLLACRDTPEASDEYKFLGWEIAVVKHLGLSMKEWHKNNNDYGLDGWDYEGSSYAAIGNIPYDSEAFDTFVDSHIEMAQKIGIVSNEGVPLVHHSRREKAKEAA